MLNVFATSFDSVDSIDAVDGLTRSTEFKKVREIQTPKKVRQLNFGDHVRGKQKHERKLKVERSRWTEVDRGMTAAKQRQTSFTPHKQHKRSL